MIEKMDVRRVETEGGSRIEPPHDLSWSPFKQLQWKAAVVSLDSGLDVWVNHSGLPSPRSFALGVVGFSTSTPHSYREAWDYLNGICTGAEAVRYMAERDA
jgi:hypothetical protein